MLADGTEIMDAFQAAYDHKVNTQAAHDVLALYSRWYADAADSADEYLEVHDMELYRQADERAAYLASRWRAGKTLLLAFNDFGQQYYAKNINVALDSRIYQDVVVSQLYPDYPVFQTELSGIHTFSARQRRGKIIGHHIINDWGYLLPIGEASNRGIFSSGTELKRLWVNVINPENGQPLVDLTFPD